MRAVSIATIVLLLACIAPSALGCGAHTIQPGDTFWGISQAKGFPVNAILAANPGVVPETLQIGQRINLPCQGGGNNGGSNGNRRPQPQPNSQPSGGGSLCNGMLPHVNAARGRHGLSPLRCSGEMDRAAQRHSNDQARNNHMTHKGSDGSEAGDRIWPMVDAMRCKRGVVSENVAEGNPGSSAQHYFDRWMNSQGHRKNILGNAITHMGVAVAKGSGRWEYATQVFSQCR